MTPTFFGPFCAFMSSITWAIGSSSYSKMSRTYSAFRINLSRAVFALPLFIVAAILTGGSLHELKLPNLGWLALSMTASYAVGDVLFFWSTVSLGVPGALAIASGYPILTALFGFLFLDVSMSVIQWMGLVISVGGILTVILTDPKRPVEAEAGETIENPAASKIVDEKAESLRSSPAPVAGWKNRKIFGVLLGVGTAICWVTNTIAVGRGGAGINPALGSAVRMAVAILLTFFFGLLMDRRPPRLMPGADFRRYAWIFVIEAFGGSYFFIYGLAHSSLVLGAVLSSLAPVIAVPVAVGLRLERFSLLRTAAVIAVVGGLALL